MARFRPERPAWVRDKTVLQAHPWPTTEGADDPDDPTGYMYTMACTVSGIDELVLISWRAVNRGLAEITFRQWLEDGWAVLSRTFFNEPCRFVFRTGAITGFGAPR